MSSKNSRVKIHVGRNQKFTSKNSWSKNSHGPIWVGRVGLCSCAQMARAMMAGTDGGPWCKGEKKKRHRQRARVLLVLIVGHIAPARVPYKGKRATGPKISQKSKNFWPP